LISKLDRHVKRSSLLKKSFYNIGPRFRSNLFFLKVIFVRSFQLYFQGPISQNLYKHNNTFWRNKLVRFTPDNIFTQGLYLLLSMGAYLT